MNDNLELNCKGTFPSWSYNLDIGGVLWKPEEICHGCKYLQACTMKRSSEILMGKSISQELFEVIGGLSELQQEIF